MTRVYKCSTCHVKHTKPTGKGCKHAPTPDRDMSSEQTAEPTLANVLAAVTGIQASVKEVSDRVAALESGNVSKSDDSDDNTTPDDEVVVNKRKKHTAKKVRDPILEARMRALQLTSDDEDSSDDGDSKSRSKSRSRRGKKSGRTKTAAEYTKKSLCWPQYYIFRGPTRAKPAFDKLTVQEFTAGFLTMLEHSTKTPETKGAMLDYLKRHMYDAQTYPWEVVRHFHGIIMQHCEQKLLNWTNKAAIDELCMLYLVQMGAEHKATTATVAQGQGARPKTVQGPQPTASRYAVVKGLRYCMEFQQGTCLEKASPHSSDNGKVSHICAFCYKKHGYSFQHAEQDCMRKDRFTDRNAKHGTTESQ